MNVIQTLLAQFNAPQLLEQLAGVIGGSTVDTRNGVGAAVPAILAGLLAKSSTEGGAASIIDLMREHKFDPHVIDRAGNLFGGHTTDEHVDAGRAMVNAVLGERYDVVADLVGASSGLTTGSVNKLMALAAPLVLGGVAKASPAGGFSVAGLTDFLASQKEHLAAAAPPGLGSLLGLGHFDSAAPVAAAGSSIARAVFQGAGSGTTALATAEDDGPAILPWLLGAALIALLVFVGLRTCSPKTHTTVAETPAVPAESVPEPVAPEPAPATAEIKLPSGTTLTVPPGSVGENLFKFLTGSETGSKTFLFDGLTFESGSALLDANSQATIAAIADILKEFADVTVSVDGYTDNQGAAQANQMLSAARAQTVIDALAAAGVDKARLSGAGHGDEKPVADNST